MNKKIVCAFALLCVLLGGCSTTKVFKNENVELKEYKELYLVPPKDDSRKVVSSVVNEFENLGFNITIIDPEKPMMGAQGTGFLISNSGHVLTCAHVVEGTDEATLWLNGNRYEADVISKDEELDLAIVKTRTPVEGVRPIGFRKGSKYKMGDDVYTIGYPVSKLLGDSARLTKGLISSVSGLKDDKNQMQISAEIQPGNSGGPLLDNDGVVVGVVQQTLNPWAMAAQTGGALPQNINFAIKSNVVLDFIRESDKDLYSEMVFDLSSDIEEVEGAVVKLQSGIMPEELEKEPKLVAMIDYKSMWDVWFRFRYFILSFYDYDTNEFLFRAGQDRDNPLSTEKSVIKDTINEVREVLGIEKVVVDSNT